VGAPASAPRSPTRPHAAPRRWAHHLKKSCLNHGSSAPKSARAGVAAAVSAAAFAFRSSSGAAAAAAARTTGSACCAEGRGRGRRRAKPPPPPRLPTPPPPPRSIAHLDRDGDTVLHLPHKLGRRAHRVGRANLGRQGGVLLGLQLAGESFVGVHVGRGVGGRSRCRRAAGSGDRGARWGGRAAPQTSAPAPARAPRPRCARAGPRHLPAPSRHHGGHDSVRHGLPHAPRRRPGRRLAGGRATERWWVVDGVWSGRGRRRAGRRRPTLSPLVSSLQTCPCRPASTRPRTNRTIWRPTAARTRATGGASSRWRI